MKIKTITIKGVSLKKMPAPRKGLCFGCYLFENYNTNDCPRAKDGHSICQEEEEAMVWVEATPVYVVSSWQDGYTLPQEPGLYQCQFSVIPDTIFNVQDDDNNYHYFDGKVWYLWGSTKKKAIDEWRKNRKQGTKYEHSPWRGLIEESK
jgi:hypothetical protein